MEYELNSKVHYLFGNKILDGEIIGVKINTLIISGVGGERTVVETAYKYLVAAADGSATGGDYDAQNFKMAEAKLGLKTIKELRREWEDKSNLTPAATNEKIRKFGATTKGFTCPKGTLDILDQLEVHFARILHR